VAEERLQDHLDRLGTSLEELRGLTGHRLPDRKARKAQIKAMQAMGDRLRDRVWRRGRAVRRTDRQLVRLARRRRRAVNGRLLGARLTLAAAGISGVFRIYWRVMALTVAAGLLVYAIWLIWPYAMDALDSLREMIRPAQTPPPGPAAAPSPPPPAASPPAAPPASGGSTP